MRKQWLKVVLLAFIAMGFSFPAWAVQLKLHGSYRMEGRYFKQPDILKGAYGAEAHIGGEFIPTFSYNATYTQAYAQYNAYYQGLGYSAAQAADLATTAATTAATAAKTYDPYVPFAPITDLVENEAYIKHFFHLNPELVVNDKISIKADIVAYENKLSSDAYGLGEYNQAYVDEHGNIYYNDYMNTDVDSMGYGFRHSYDRYNIFRINYLWADFTTDFGKFVLGRTPNFTGIGYFIKLPSLDKWTFGLIYHKDDEGGNNYYHGYLTKWFGGPRIDSDTADETGIILVTNYDTDNLSVHTQLIYGTSGSNESKTHEWIPVAKVNYSAGPLKVEFFGRWKYGIYADNDATMIRNAAQQFLPLLTGLDATYQSMGVPISFLNTTNPMGARLRDDLRQDAYSAYLDLKYEMDKLTPEFTIAYASGADNPTKVSGYFNDDQTFGSWLMSDAEDNDGIVDRYGMYFETPTANTYDALGNPANDRYSFSNIILARLGGTTQVTDKLTLEGNVIWARRANTDYLEEWNPELGTLNLINKVVTKIDVIGQYDPTTGFTNPTQKWHNKVDPGLGWECNAKATYDVMDHVSFAVQAAYFRPGDFYKDAFEKAYGYTRTGLRVKSEYAARWIATVSF